MAVNVGDGLGQTIGQRCAGKDITASLRADQGVNVGERIVRWAGQRGQWEEDEEEREEGGKQRMVRRTRLEKSQ